MNTLGKKIVICDEDEKILFQTELDSIKLHDLIMTNDQIYEVLKLIHNGFEIKCICKISTGRKLDKIINYRPSIKQKMGTYLCSMDSESHKHHITYWFVTPGKAHTGRYKNHKIYGVQANYFAQALGFEDVQELHSNYKYGYFLEIDLEFLKKIHENLNK